jgi:uncharacterized membrane protein
MMIKSRTRTDVRPGNSRQLVAAKLTLLAGVLTSGLSAGFFFTYAVSVTRGLRLVDDATYVATMQSINETVRTGWFAVVFFGPLPLLAAAAILMARLGAPRHAVITAAAAALYAVGVLGVTFLGNVPLNDDLAETTSTSPAALELARHNYEDSWNDLNLIRTLTAVAVFALAATTIANRHRHPTEDNTRRRGERWRAGD